MSKHRVFIGAMVGLLLVLGGFIYLQERVVQLGDEVILATRPVDPRDLFRGEYVILRYAIENDEQVRAAINDDPDATQVFVRLTPAASGIAEVSAATTRRPDVSSGIWLRGEVDGQRARFPDLEQFFVPEGAGLPIERLGADLHVRVRIHEGEARVVGLLDGELAPIDPSDYVE